MIRSCTCRDCQDCCRHIPGALTRVSDLERVERATRRDGESEEAWAKRVFVASDGAVLGTLAGDRIDVPDLALRSAPGSDACAFFRGGRCGIYDGRPSGCSDFDTCQQTAQEAMGIGLEMHRRRLESMLASPESRYWRLWRMLRDAGQARSRSELDRRLRRLRDRSARRR